MLDYDYMVEKVFKVLVNDLKEYPEEFRLPTKYGCKTKYITKDFELLWEWSRFHDVQINNMHFYIKNPYSGPHLLSEDQQEMFKKKLKQIEDKIINKAFYDKKDKLFQKYLEFFPNG